MIEPRNPVAGADQLVVLDPDHPGFRDSTYRARRNAIAKLALDHREGEPAPIVAYTAEEHAVWRTVCEHLAPLHAARAVRAWRDVAARMALDPTRIPQLAEVNAITRPRGIEMHPVAGLITAEGFLTALARGVFRSTQYMRHHSTPLYTPEPDVVHELIGHAASFMAPEIVELSRAFGDAALRADPARMLELERVYWFTLEFGLAHEDGELKAYGAGLLSSYGELGALGELDKRAELAAFDLDAMARTAYDPTAYQRTLFVAPSFDTAVAELHAWLVATTPRRRLRAT